MYKIKCQEECEKDTEQNSFHKGFDNCASVPHCNGSATKGFFNCTNIIRTRVLLKFAGSKYLNPFKKRTIVNRT